MATRQNFSGTQRDSAFRANAEWLQKHKVDGVQLVMAAEPLRALGQVYHCENCGFASTDRAHFDVDHLVADRSFRLWGRHEEARSAINMVILCKSTAKNDLGCNQTKGSRLYVPHGRGLAYTRADLDLNWTPIRDRPFPFTATS